MITTLSGAVWPRSHAPHPVFRPVKSRRCWQRSAASESIVMFDSSPRRTLGQRATAHLATSTVLIAKPFQSPPKRCQTFNRYNVGELRCMRLFHTLISITDRNARISARCRRSRHYRRCGRRMVTTGACRNLEGRNRHASPECRPLLVRQSCDGNWLVNVILEPVMRRTSLTLAALIGLKKCSNTAAGLTWFFSGERLFSTSAS